MKFKILHQGLLLISIPLVCELAVFGVLVKLELDAEMQAAKAGHARAISDGVNALERDLHAVARFLSSLQYAEALSADFKPYFDKINGDIASLKHLTADRAECLPILNRTEEAAHKGQAELAQAKQALLDEPWKAYAIAKHARQTIGNDLSMTVSTELLDLATKSVDEGEEQAAENARRQIRTTLLAAVPFSLLIAICAAFLFARNIANRIEKLSLDAQLMAKGERLSPALKGSDEIAQLDQIYHQSARLLDESNRKLQAAFDYAADLILSIDGELRIASINKACSEMLGMTPEQLSFKRIVEIIAPADRDNFLHLLEEVENAPDKLQNLEIRLTHSKGQLVPTICLPRYSYLEKATFCVFHDISLRKEAERIRAEVFAMVTHDLRAPVASFDAFLEFAEMGKLGVLSDAGKRLLPAAEHSVTKMKQLLNDILNLEKIKSGAAQVQNAPVSVDEIMAAIAKLVLFAAEKRSVQMAITPSNVIVLTDRDRLEQVLLNFVSNALKFSPPGSKIELFCHRSSGDGDLYISVKDQGPGIKPDEINSVFDRFYEGTKGDTDLPSSGLGLAICQEVARLLGARLEVQSTLGKGSTFSVIFQKDRCK